MGEERDIFFKIIYIFIIWAYRLHPWTRTPDPGLGVMDFTILIEDLMDTITKHLLFLKFMWE